MRLGAGLAILAACACLNGAHADGGDNRAGKAQGATDFVIGPVTLHLRPNLVGPLGGSSKAGAASLSLQFLLPDFEPMTPQNYREFTSPSQGRRISIFLEYPGRLRDPHDALYGVGGMLVQSLSGVKIEELPSNAAGLKNIAA